MNVQLIVQLVKTMAPIILDALASQPQPGWRVGAVSDPVRCEYCDAEPWVIRWGNIRVAQELDGYLSVASLDGPVMVCRACWARRDAGEHDGAH